jgi:hypothetical protein
MLRYLMIVAALFASVYLAVHVHLITRPAFLESVIDEVESEVKEVVEKAPTPRVSEEAPPALSPPPASVAVPAPSVTPEKAAEPAAASPVPTPKAAQGHHAPRAKKTAKPHWHERPGCWWTGRGVLHFLALWFSRFWLTSLSFSALTRAM